MQEKQEQEDLAAVEEHLAEARKKFKEMDKDGSGCLDANEIRCQRTSLLS